MVSDKEESCYVDTKALLYSNSGLLFFCAYLDVSLTRCSHEPPDLSEEANGCVHLDIGGRICCFYGLKAESDGLQRHVPPIYSLELLGR